MAVHLTCRNVNEAFRVLVESIHEGWIPTEVEASRYGEVIRVPEPVIVTYTSPLERVLFNAARDANPFFSLYESTVFPRWTERCGSSRLLQLKDGGVQ
jgi:hypothetical protein